MGKGSRPRPVDFDRFGRNFDRIFGKDRGDHALVSVPVIYTDHHLGVVAEEKAIDAALDQTRDDFGAEAALAEARAFIHGLLQLHRERDQCEG